MGQCVRLKDLLFVTWKPGFPRLLQAGNPLKTAFVYCHTAITCLIVEIQFEKERKKRKKEKELSSAAADSKTFWGSRCIRVAEAVRRIFAHCYWSFSPLVHFLSLLRTYGHYALWSKPHHRIHYLKPRNRLKKMNPAQVYQVTACSLINGFTV